MTRKRAPAAGKRQAPATSEEPATSLAHPMLTQDMVNRLIMDDERRVPEPGAGPVSPPVARPKTARPDRS